MHINNDNSELKQSYLAQGISTYLHVFIIIQALA